jgi:hypothetical protein
MIFLAASNPQDRSPISMAQIEIYNGQQRKKTISYSTRLYKESLSIKIREKTIQENVTRHKLEVNKPSIH